MDFKFLVQCIEDQEQQQIDYRRVGVIYKTMKINLSQVMYKTLEIKRKGYRSPLIKVDEKSYDNKRSHILEGILLSLYSMIEKDLTADHVYINIRHQIQFINFLSSKAIPFPKNIQEAKKVFTVYKRYLQNLVITVEIKNNMAHYLHRASYLLLCYLFEDKANEIGGIKIIKYKNTSATAFDGIRKSKGEIEYTFIFYYNFFDQIADFVLEGKEYPYNIKLPKGNAVLTPRAGCDIVPSYMPISKNAFKCINYQEGRIKTKEERLCEFIDFPGNNKKYIINHGCEKLLERLALVNTDSTHDLRLALGNKAMKAFFTVLLAITGINDSILGKILWENDDFTTTKESQDFVGIKPRANNKKVLFEIRKNFIGSFKFFLKLRRFVLNGRNCNFLFFNLYCTEIHITTAQLNGRYAYSNWKTLFKRMDDELPNAFSQDFRKDKTLEFLGKGAKYAIAGLQNSYDTMINHYNGQSGESMAKEMHNAITFLNEGIVTLEKSVDEEAVLLGECESKEQKPIQDDQTTEVEADCNDLKTCIFCIYFRTHPNENDIRKLYSLEFIIKEISLPRAKSHEDYELSMKPWLKRIDQLLKQMLLIDPGCKSIMDKVEQEVYKEQLLTPYWGHLLEDFEILGVLR